MMVRCYWCISILIIIPTIRCCSLTGPFCGWSAVVLSDRRYPSFWNFDSTISIDVIRMKSYMDSLFDPTCVPVRVTINKLNFFPNRKMPRFVSVFRNCRGLRTSKPPRIYGQPKIHKPEIPLRPIVSCVNTFAYDLSAHLADILSPLTGKSDYTVTNSSHFVSTISHERIQENEVLVSFDVESLLTNVPIEGAVTAALCKLENDPGLADRTNLTPTQIADLLNFVLRSTEPNTSHLNHQLSLKKRNIYHRYLFRTGILLHLYESSQRQQDQQPTKNLRRNLNLQRIYPT